MNSQEQVVLNRLLRTWREEYIGPLYRKPEKIVQLLINHYCKKVSKTPRAWELEVIFSEGFHESLSQKLTKEVNTISKGLDEALKKINFVPPYEGWEDEYNYEDDRHPDEDF